MYNNPWVTKGIKKSSKRKQKSYEKFLKNRNEKNEKLYKDLFESVKRKPKRIYYSSKKLGFKNNAILNQVYPNSLLLKKKEVTEILTI